jgi:CRISPR/Cas system CSM-associated protein Csm3 (group 7 of RAMP superfamily)
MNPYDFVRVDWNRPPERRKPVWHHRLVGQDGQRLYAGQIEVNVFAEKPIFIPERNASQDPKKPAQFMRNKQGEYIIPGSSLKGMLRCLVETLGNGCFTLIDGQYERGKVSYRSNIPESHQHCGDNTKLCIACRTFGMLKERTSGVFLGKVDIGDACANMDKVYKYDPIYTAVLVEPKPHHLAFYLDETRQHIAGRKYYFHHSPDAEPLTADRLIYFPGGLANRYILPLDINTQFHFRVDFTNLEADEFAALLLAITLEENMYHKIGYGKPLGLGSIQLIPTSITLVDYSTRYIQRGSGNGKTTVEGDAMWALVDEHVAAFAKTQLLQVAIEDLRRIWRWPPDPTVDYYYPSKRDWFDTEDSIGKRIADTKKVP